MKYTLAFILFIYSSILSAQSPLGEVYKVKGDVTLERANQAINLKHKDKILVGDIVATKKKSLIVIRLSEGSFLKLGSHSKMKMDLPRSKKGLNLINGSVFAKVAKDLRKKEKAAFKIRTKTAVAGVRGTEFFTSYGSHHKPEDVWLCVNEGAVEVQDLKSKKSVLVKEGEGISVTKNGVSKPRPLAWTRKLNWSMQGQVDDLENQINIEDAYTDLLDQDYD